MEFIISDDSYCSYSPLPIPRQTASNSVNTPSFPSVLDYKYLCHEIISSLREETTPYHSTLLGYINIFNRHVPNFIDEPY